MIFFSNGWFKVVVFAIAVASISTYADFQPERIYKLRQKVSLDAGWKFYRNNPTGTGNPYDIAYSDAAWQTVNVPHSAMYVEPTIAGEKSTMPDGTTWTGICWYRKTFTLPAGAHTQKIYLQFEGAMQSTSVYLNGTLVGGNGASGFTPFNIDISSVVNRTGANVLAVRLDANYSHDIPPGNVPMTSPKMGEYPDFYIYNGLYRDVWLLCADNVSIAPWGQKITTPQVSSTSATIRIRTTVNNASAAAANCVVQSVVANAAGAIIAQATATGSIAANGSQVFDCTTPTIANPSLWSPETPNLYRVFTKVLVNNIEVDDNVERIGIRSLDWRTAGGFFLNGSRYVLKGVNMHQEFAWVCNAVPNSRHFEEVRLVKNMGANAIRCAHYPRDPAFYDACDEFGVLCEPELPGWGGSITSYNPIFWNRMDTCAEAMVKSAINHPSIILWGLFNEAAGDFPDNFREIHNRIKNIDSTRFTSFINNKIQNADQVTDVFGQNYGTTPNWANARYYNAEYHEGWMYFCNRGDTVTRSTSVECFVGGSGCTLESENQYANERYTLRWLRDILPNTGDSKPLAGGHMWCFIDYWSPCNVGNHPMGALDHYRIPKKVYYTFRTAWNSGADDYPTVGLSAAKLKVEADLTTLNADSTDLSRVIVSVRDASDKCVWDARSVNLQVTGPANMFDPPAQTTIAGKIGYILKSTNTPGTITLTATATGLTQGTLTITSKAPDNSSLPFIWTGSGIAGNGLCPFIEKSIAVFQNNRFITVMFPGSFREKAVISLLTMQGKKVFDREVTKKTSAVMNTRMLGAGIYYLNIEAMGTSVSKKIVVTR
jgi:hypothetical protein